MMKLKIRGVIPDNIDCYSRIYNVMRYIKIFGMLLLCIIFLGVGIFVLFLDNRDKKECTVPVTSTVAELVASSKGTYAPVYDYEYEGRHYMVKSNNYSNPCPFSVGESVQIYIDSDDPEHIYNPKDKTGKIVAFVFIGIGAVGMLVFLALGLMYIMNRKNKSEEEYYLNEQVMEYPDEESEYYSEENEY